MAPSIAQYDLSKNALVGARFVESGSSLIGMKTTDYSINAVKFVENSSYSNKLTLSTTGTLTAPQFIEVLPTGWKYLLVVGTSVTDNGHGISYDSFDSSLGPYNVTTRKANAYLVASSSISNSIVIGGGGGLNAFVYGYLGFQSNVNTASYSVGVNSAVGDLTFIGGNNTGIQSGHFITSSFQENVTPIGPLFLPNSIFTPQPEPYTSGFPLVFSSSGAIKNKYILTSSGDYYYNGNISGSYVVTAPNCRLYAKGNINLTSGDGITINDGSSLKLYISGSVNLGGGGVSNQNINGIPTSFICYTLTNDPVTLPNNNPLLGCIEAPLSSGAFGGGGVSLIHYTGYYIFNTLTFNASIALHMDEATTR